MEGGIAKPVVENGDPNVNASELQKELKLLQDPFELANIQAIPRESPYEFINNLPKPVQKRIQALKKLQLEATHIEAEFYKKVHELECQYAQKFKPLADKRKTIVTGEYEPNEQECDYPLFADEELAKELCEKAHIAAGESGDIVDAKVAAEKENSVTGVPHFWKTIWTNCDILSDMVQEHDIGPLEHLTDVEVKVTEKPMGFTLYFHFSPNEWFSNSVLTKEYFLRCEPDKDDPFDFDGPEIIGCKGCTIDWKANKNITVKLIKKKQKHKQRSATRFVTKQVKADSLFNFFSPPPSPSTPDEEENMDEESRELLNSDFEIGQMLRDRVIPRAVLYYTGEAREDDGFEDEDDESYDDEDDDEDESEDDDGEHGGVTPGDQV